MLLVNICNAISVHAYNSFIVPTFTIAIVPFGPLQGDLVGTHQEIHCTASTVSGVMLNAVRVTWARPGEIITNSSRVTISPIMVDGNDFINTLDFAYLMEGDDGSYTCDIMILETVASDFIEINNLTGTVCMLLMDTHLYAMKNL